MIDVGQTVGNYKLTAKLGEGGMGIVFLAEHPVIGTKVALKAIHPYFARNADVVSRFVTEARAVNQIQHEHIVNITDFGHTPAGDFYFIMEFLQGEMLSGRLFREGALPPARALNIAAQIADALHASHEHGVIHRDLKPDNVFLLPREATSDFVKIFDFGLAKLSPMGGATPTHNTGPGAFMGTPYYMSPEQCDGKTPVDHRADIYALGVILFEMLTGCVPFGGEGYGEVIVKHITVRPPTARSLVPDLPPAIDAILSRALSKDPGQRYQTMADFRAALLDPEGHSMTRAPASGQDTARAATPAFARHEDFDDSELKPKRSHGGLFLVGVAALTGLAVVSTTVRHVAAEVLVSAAVRTKASAGRVDFEAVRGKTNQLFADAVALARPFTAHPSVASAPQAPGGGPSDPKEAEQPSVAVTAAPLDDPPIATVPSRASMTLRMRDERPRHRPPLRDDGDATLPPSVE
jgi:hypothetical protein